MTDIETAGGATSTAGRAGEPSNVIVLLLDSLNRHMLGSYGGTEFDTPNIDRLAARSLRFEKHFAGSLPCMPARHDILVGALDFLWRPWGSIEVWEDSIVRQLTLAGVTSMMVADHPHLFETGGENYHTDFTGWEYVRGSEADAWRTRPDPSHVGSPALPAIPSPIGMPYDLSRTWFRDEQDWPGPRTMSAAESWLDHNAGAHDRFLLFVDEFDPHEPFDTPEPWMSKYDPEWEGPHLIWPPYGRDVVARGDLTERQAHQLRSNYGSKLSMIDHWVGRVLDAVDRNGLWDDTAVFLCTDHGHYLGERDLWGKPAVPLYEPLVHIPLLVAWPGLGPRSVGALTTSVDLSATLADIFGVSLEHRTHGRSLVPLITGEEHSVRESALAGVWGREVHVIDGRRKYIRCPDGSNDPLAMWSNRWSTMPIKGLPQIRMPRPDRRAKLAFMPGSDVPVIRQPFQPGDMYPYWAAGPAFEGNRLYDLDEDPAEAVNLADGRGERDAEELLRAALEEVEAPHEQFERLGLA